ncbi:hypothetical protein WA026_023422 [Henosepilachna vigintioctopunctata]|uniref:Uncharacterized protein n=1 Tax=Henosepilachna vigintioctopunctata TaxID=420089 RepID=A0AAW1TZ37_9CUCU
MEEVQTTEKVDGDFRPPPTKVSSKTMSARKQLMAVAQKLAEAPTFAVAPPDKWESFALLVAGDLRLLKDVKQQAIAHKIISDAIFWTKTPYCIIQYFLGTFSLSDSHTRKYKEALFKKFTPNDRYLGKIFPGISFYTKIKLAELANFFKTYPEAGAGTAVKWTLQNVRNNIFWLSKYNDS